MQDITIVTVSTNRLDPDCLTSVEQTIAATPLKVTHVIVDNNSSQYEAHSYVKKYAPHAQIILRNKNHGFGAGNNRGAAELPAKYYFFLNPDTKFSDSRILKHLFDFMENNLHAGIAAPKLFSMNGQVQPSCWRWPKWYMPLVQRTNIFPKPFKETQDQYFIVNNLSDEHVSAVDWAQGSALFVRGELFDELGGFDERFFVYLEDTDLCRRSWTKNKPVYYVPQTSLCHVYNKESASKDRRLISNVLQVFQSHLSRVHIYSWIKYHLKWLA